MNPFTKYEEKLASFRPEVRNKVLEYAKEFYQQGYTRNQAIEQGIYKAGRIYRSLY